MVGRNYKWLDKEMLTPKQLKLLKFLIEYKKEKQYMPSFKEMKVYMNVKSNSVVYHMLGYIEWKGYIKRYPAQARAIEIIKEVA
jgi:SOS-response transcriptional repressor LexA|tara:strand:- start:74 stop:325 length:252 start_codon:yes stop_codon:yes gene_type:complete